MESKLMREEESMAEAEISLTTRLQRRAPASLDLITNINCVSGWENGPCSRAPIPLLTPPAISLIKPPIPLLTPVGSNPKPLPGAEGKETRKILMLQCGNGWQHPAIQAAAAMDSSTFFPFLQPQYRMAHKDVCMFYDLL